MTFNITTFREALNFDGARPNLFEVSVLGLSQKFNFTCKTAQLPGSTIGIVEVPYFGRSVKLAGNRTFADWTVTILNDEDFLIRNELEQWLADINTHQGNISQKLSTTYMCDATVTQYSKEGNAIKSYNFVGMFPTDLAPIDLDWGSNDTIEEYSVTFAYQYWTSTTVPSSII